MLPRQFGRTTLRPGLSVPLFVSDLQLIPKSGRTLNKLVEMGRFERPSCILSKVYQQSELETMVGLEPTPHHYLAHEHHLWTRLRISAFRRFPVRCISAPHGLLFLSPHEELLTGRFMFIVCFIFLKIFSTVFITIFIPTTKIFSHSMAIWTK